MSMLARPRFNRALIVVTMSLMLGLTSCDTRDPVSYGSFHAFDTAIEVTLIGVERRRATEIVQMLEAERESPAPEVFPLFGEDDGQIVVMFRGDAGYETGDASAEGARHRALLVEKRWEYVYRDVTSEFPPLLAEGRA